MSYGITEDTGGHITYVLGEMRALAQRDDVSHAEIVTRLFDAPELGAVHGQPSEVLGPKVSITRIDSGDRRYLAKESLAADRRAYADALIAELRARDHLPDLIHAHFADAADVARRVEQALGIPFIYTAHSLGIDKMKSGGSEMALRARIAEEDAAIRHASAIIGSSRDECERQICAYSSAQVDRIHVIPPGIDRYTAGNSDENIAAAQHLIAPFLRDPNKPTILTIARPVRKKNLIALLDAFATNSHLRSHCNLVVLAGQRNDLDSGEAEHCEVLTELVNAIDRYDLYGSIAYPKKHSAQHTDGLYRLAAKNGGVFVNPALVEPYGLTICEAATYGLPVIATNVGGPVDSVRELGHGELVDPTDRDRISAAIIQMINDDQRWNVLSNNGLRNSEAMSWANYAEQFMQLAQSILSRKATFPTADTAQYRSLVVSDLDNTLTGCNRGARRLADFFARRSGFGFVAATGRSIIEAQRIVREWGLPDPLAWITSTGSEIYWRRDGRLVRDSEFDCMIMPDWNPDAVRKALAKIEGLMPQPIYEQRQFKRSYFYQNDATIDRVVRALRDGDQDVRIIPSHGDLLDILPKNAGKGRAMQHVARMLDIPAERVVAIGDSGNDIDMLTMCQNAVMVGNYAPELASLSNRPNVYVSRRHNAAGALEGIFAHHSRQKRQNIDRKRAS
ncbi:MAG: HAD-IIB family hydrolase [Pontixanthobacter sp.]